MQVLEEILYELEKRIFTAEVYNDDFDGTTITNLICLGDVRDILEKHMNDGWLPVEKYGLPKEEGIYDLTIINGRGEYVSVRWEFLSGVHLSGQQHYVDGVHYWADNYRGEPINEFLSERVIAWRKKPEPYRPERSDNHDRE